MKPDFNPDLIPHNFLYCMNGQCKRAASCLRHLLTSHTPADQKVISILNPAHTVDGSEECANFMPDKKQQFALGITHLLDNVPHSEATALKQALIAYFNRSTYYRCWRKERLISPGEQEHVRQIFISRGIKEEPVYDEYIKQYEW